MTTKNVPKKEFCEIQEKEKAHNLIYAVEYSHMTTLYNKCLDAMCLWGLQCVA